MRSDKTGWSEPGTVTLGRTGNTGYGAEALFSLQHIISIRPPSTLGLGVVRRVLSLDPLRFYGSRRGHGLRRLVCGGAWTALLTGEQATGASVRGPRTSRRSTRPDPSLRAGHPDRAWLTFRDAPEGFQVLHPARQRTRTALYSVEPRASEGVNLIVRTSNRTFHPPTGKGEKLEKADAQSEWVLESVQIPQCITSIPIAGEIPFQGI